MRFLFAMLFGLGAWLLLFLSTRVVSLGSIAAAITLPIATWFTECTDRVPLTCLTATLALMAILKHRANIQRLFAGTEPRLDLGRKKKGEPT